jgi:hypothetical protein
VRRVYIFVGLLGWSAIERYEFSLDFFCEFQFLQVIRLPETNNRIKRDKFGYVVSVISVRPSVLVSVSVSVSVISVRSSVLIMPRSKRKYRLFQLTMQVLLG